MPCSKRSERTNGLRLRRMGAPPKNLSYFITQYASVYKWVRVLYELRPSGPATAEELIEQFNRKVNFIARDGEGRRESEDVFIVAAHVQH